MHLKVNQKMYQEHQNSQISFKKKDKLQSYSLGENLMKDADRHFIKIAKNRLNFTTN